MKAKSLTCAIAVVLFAWAMVCGSAVAAKTNAVSCQEGELLVRVSDPGWRLQLEGLAPQYVEQINVILPQKIHSIRFVP